MLTYRVFDVRPLDDDELIVRAIEAIAEPEIETDSGLRVELIGPQWSR